MRTLQGAIVKFPKESAVTLSLASTLERQGKFGDAEAVFRQMLADDPKNADALAKMAARAARSANACQSPPGQGRSIAVSI